MRKVQDASACLPLVELIRLSWKEHRGLGGTSLTVYYRRKGRIRCTRQALVVVCQDAEWHWSNDGQKTPITRCRSNPSRGYRIELVRTCVAKGSRLSLLSSRMRL